MKIYALTILMTLATSMVLTGCEQESTPEGEGAGTEQAQPGQPGDNAISPGEDEHTTTGIVTAVDESAARVTVDHAPVPSMEWPAMTMQFKVADPELLRELEAGDQVRFSFQDQGGSYVIHDIEKQ